MKIYLHIGTHKTGTTAIQHFCSAHATALLAHGIYWPAETLARYKRQHSYLSNMLRDSRRADAQAYLDRAVTAAEHAGATALLMSGEGLSQLDTDQISALIDILKGHDVEVIVYFRNIQSYAVSILHQRLKRGGVDLDLSRVLVALRKKLNYTALLNQWQTGTGACNLTVRCYEKEKARLVPSFLEILGVSDPALLAAAQTKANGVNQSLDIATQLLLATSGFNSKLDKFKDFRADYQTLFTGQPFFAPGTLQIARALCEGATLDLSHPLLAPHREQLSAPMQAPSSAQDIVAYMDRLGKLLRRAARKQRWRARLQWLLSLLQRRRA